MYKTQL